MIRVCLVDDQALIRSGLKALLGLLGGIEVVAEAADGEEALVAVGSSKPDVLLLDVRMPRLNGVQVVEALASQGSLPPTLMLTTFEDDSALIQGVKAGARGYLLKGASPETLLEAIRAVAAGDALLSPAITKRVIRQFTRIPRPAPPKELDELTAREQDILLLIARGLSNSEIGQQLYISETTVKTHVTHILAKLGLRDRVQAVVLAYQTGLFKKRAPA